MVKLFCVNVGIPGIAFYVDIRDDAYACDLNEVIKLKTPNQLKNVDGYALQLFMAKKDKGKGTWLTAAEAADVRYESISQEFEPINAARVLKSPDNFEEFRPGDNQIHVLVVAPLCLLALYDELVVDDVNIRKTQSMMMNPPALVKFWRAFQEIPFENEADSVIALPEGTFILGDPIHGSRIYIRPCYPQLWEVCSDIIHDEAMNTPHLVILVNPGIGKTYFGYVILLYLARLGETVVYESRRTKKRFLFSRNVVVEGSQEDFDPILHLPTTYYIVDAIDSTVSSHQVTQRRRFL